MEQGFPSPSGTADFLWRLLGDQQRRLWALIFLVVFLATFVAIAWVLGPHVGTIVGYVVGALGGGAVVGGVHRVRKVVGAAKRVKEE